MLDAQGNKIIPPEPFEVRVEMSLEGLMQAGTYTVLLVSDDSVVLRCDTPGFSSYWKPGMLLETSVEWVKEMFRPTPEVSA